MGTMIATDEAFLDTVQFLRATINSLNVSINNLNSKLSENKNDSSESIDLLRGIMTSSFANLNSNIEKISKNLEKRQKAEDELMDQIKMLNANVAQINGQVHERKNVDSHGSAAVNAQTNPICEGNITRLLNTFDNALQSSAKNISVINEEVMKNQSVEINRYIGMFTERYSDALSKYTDKMAECFNNSINKLSEDMSKYIGELAEKNAAAVGKAIAQVQGENNRELQNLSITLNKYIDENRNTIQENRETNEAVSANVNKLIDWSSNMSNEIKENTDSAIIHIRRVMDEKITGMTTELDKLERNNAEYFRDTMENYREKFVQANAEAIADTVIDLSSSVKETQGQIRELSDYVTKSFDLVNENKEFISKFTAGTDDILNEMKDINRELAEKSVSNLKDIEVINKKCMDEIKETVTELSLAIDEYKATSVETQENYEKILTDSKDINKTNAERIYDTINKMSKKFIELTENNEETIKMINTNTEAYNSALTEIRRSQERAAMLSEQDFKLLERLIK